MLPLVFGGGSRIGTSFSGLPGYDGPGYDALGSALPIRLDGNGNVGALSRLDCWFT